MRKNSAISTTIIVFVLQVYSLFHGHSYEEFRSFTNSDGRTIEATVLSINDGDKTIRIRLRNDSEFSVPIGSLSVDDQAWIAEKIEKDRLAGDIEGWKQLTISLPLPTSRVEAPGIYGAFYRVGARTWRGEIPDGTWIVISDVVEGNGEDYVSSPELLTKFNASWSSLIVEFSDGLFTGSYDGKKARVIGATCKVVTEGVDQNRGIPGRFYDPDKTLRAQQDTFQKAVSNLKDGEKICMQPAMTIEEEELRLYRSTLDSLVLNGGVQLRKLRSDSKTKVKAIRLLPKSGVDGEDIKSLSGLEFFSSNSSVEDLSQRTFRPPLRQLHLGLIKKQKDLDELSEITSLEFIKIDRSGDSDLSFNIASWENLQQLKGIDFNPQWCRVNSESVSRCKGLRVIRFEDPNMDSNGTWIAPLTKIRNMFWSAHLDNVGIIALAENDFAFQNLRFLRNRNSTPFKSTPVLRAITYPGFTMKDTRRRTMSDGTVSEFSSSSLSYIWPIHKMLEAENLEFIAVSGVNQETLDVICNKKNPESVRTLLLGSLEDCYDLSGLQKLKNLRVLSLSFFRDYFPDGREAGRILDVSGLEALELLEFVPNGPNIPVRANEIEFKIISMDRTPDIFGPNRLR